MTWTPIWNTANKILIFPLAIPSFSYGLYAFVAYGWRDKEVIENLKEDKEEMKRWSGSLCDPKSPNYNPFLFRKN